MVEVTDSGFTPENLADAEWLWTNLPTFPRNWSTLPTHEKALVIHTVIRHREAAAKTERDRLRKLPDDAVFDAWYKLRTERFMTIPEDDIRFIATALADALWRVSHDH